MLLSARSDNLKAVGNVDIAIVGGGAVGLTMAVQLARSGRKVMVLEAGPAKPDDQSQAYFREATTSGHLLPGLHVGRFRCLGGTSNFWGGQLVPFSKSVFTKRPGISENGWPIGLEEILPYYKEAFGILGLENTITSDDAVWAELGLDPPPTTDRIRPIFTRWTPENNLAIHFRRDILENPNLIVVLDAQVGALQTDAAGSVTGVEIRFTDRPPIRVDAARTVLASGTVEISRLLLHPDCNGERPPWASNLWIGRGFMDHVDCYAGTVEPTERKRFSDLFDNAFINGLKYSPKLRLSDDFHFEDELLDISTHFVFNSSVAEHVANLKILAKGLFKGRLDRRALANPVALVKSLRFVVPMALRYIRYRRMTNFSDGGILLRLTSEQTPLPNSQIRLRGETDAFGMYKVDVDWKIRPEDVSSIGRFAAFVKEYLEDTGLAKVKLDTRLVNGDSSFLAETDDANHQMGGARMAAADEDGVVDENCAVFGTNNLFVAGAAVYPVSGFANPTFTAIALGLRLVDYINASLEGKLECRSSQVG